jgi:hypothetical protein
VMNAAPFHFRRHQFVLRRRAAYLKMESMQESMKYRRHHNRHDNEETGAGEQRVGGGKNLASHGMKFVHGSHAPEDHRGIHQRIES